MVATLCLGGVAQPYEKVHLFFSSLIGAIIFFWAYLNRETAPKPPQTNLLVKICLIFLLGLILLQQIPLRAEVIEQVSPLAYRLTFQTLHELEITPKSSGYPMTIDQAATQVAFDQFLAFLILLGISTLVFKKLEHRTLAATCISIFSASISFFGLIHRFSGSSKMFWAIERGWTFFGPYVNTNHAGALFATSGALSLGLLSRKISKTDRIVWTGIFGLICLGLLFTGSRSAVLSLGFAVLIHFLFQVGHAQKASRYAMTMLFLTVGTALTWKATFLSRILATTSKWTSGKEFRLDFWNYAIDLWKSAPIFGIGFGGFAKASPLAMGENLWLHPEHVENDFLELLVCGGVLGALSGGVLLVLLFKRLIQVLLSKDASTTSKALGLATIALMVNSVFVFNAPLPAHQILSVLFIGGLISSHGYSIFFDKTMKYGFALLILVGLTLGLLNLTGQRLKVKSTIDPLTIPAFEVGTSNANRRAAMLLQSAHLETVQNILSKNPIDSQALYVLAITSGQKGDFGRAQKAALAAMSLNPFDLFHRVQLGKMIGGYEKPEQAFEMIDRLLKGSAPLSATLRTDLHLDAALYAFRIGDAQAAREHLASTKALSPNDWRIPLLQMFDSNDPISNVCASWKLARSQNIESSSWDRALFILLQKKGTSSFSSQDLMDELGPFRTDIGNFLDRLSKLNKHPLVLRLNPKGDFKPNNTSSGLNGQVKEGVLQVKVIQAQTNLDIYFLPINILVEPSSLSFKMVIESPRRLESQLVVEIDGQPFLTEEPARKLGPNRWELTFHNIGQKVSVREGIVASRKITGIGFTPLERDGKYIFRSIEVFVNSMHEY